MKNRTKRKKPVNGKAKPATAPAGPASVLIGRQKVLAEFQATKAYRDLQRIKTYLGAAADLAREFLDDGASRQLILSLYGSHAAADLCGDLHHAAESAAQAALVSGVCLNGDA